MMLVRLAASLVVSLALASCSPSPVSSARLDEGQQEVFELLEEAIPLGAPVRLVVDPTLEDWGGAEWDDAAGEFVLTLHPDADPEVIAHEWGHMMVWDACGESDHDALWGVAYARAYRVAIED